MATRKVDKHNMTNNKQQTAVDFAFETLANQGLLVYKDYKNLIIYHDSKEMEKEKLKEAWNKGEDCGLGRSNYEFENAEQYYNETYGGGEQ